MASEKIRTLLVDDEPVIRQGIRELLTAYPDFTIIGEADGKSAALELLAQQDTDLILMDIQMPGGSGFELAEAVHAAYPDILFVFLTGHADFALDGYDYAPLDFLVKPVGRERFSMTVQRVLERLQQRKKSARVGIQTEDGYRLFEVGKIAYLEKADRKVRIVGKDGSAVFSGEPIQELENIFAEYGFFRCHQSYLAPMGEIVKIQKDTFGRSFRLVLGSGAELPLSRRKYYDLRDALEEQGIKLC